MVTHALLCREVRMPAFKSEDAYWRFAASVRTSRRYVRGRSVNGFLNTLRREAEARSEIMPQGTCLWRAQLGHTWETIDHDYDGPVIVPAPHPSERMKPLQDRAVEGRANSKGIPCLYVSTHMDTALAEVRPWIGSLVSVASMLTVRELKIVNCTEESDRPFFLFGAPPEHWDTIVWCDIDDAYSRPVAPSDDRAEYVPTQIIAELFKASAFDGIAYRSALGDGRNIALFDLGAAVLQERSLYELKSLGFNFATAGSSRFLSVNDLIAWSEEESG